MKKIDLSQTLGLLANVGVIAGIVFLGIELGQNNELMIDEARRARALSVEETWTILATDGELSTMMVKDRSNEDLTDVERLRLNAFWMRVLTDLQLAHQELPEDELGPIVARQMENLQRSPTYQATWNRERGTFRPEFSDFMDAEVFPR